MRHFAFAFALSVGLSYVAWRARRNDARVPKLDVSGAVIPKTISLIVPARDEAHNLRILLPSLHAQSLPPLELIVVDDASRDETSAVAFAHGAEVVQVTYLPQGWAGKAHACYVGAERARGEWLLFVDADVRLYPCALERLLAAAQHAQLTVLSVLLHQQCGSWFERLLMPYVYAQYFVGAPVREHFDPLRPQAILNGQCILIRRETYFATGGFARVRGALMEDLAFAHALKAQGVPLGFAHGDAVGEVRMYRTPRALWRGFAKTGLATLSYYPRGGMWTVAAQLLGSTIATALFVSARKRSIGALSMSLLGYAVGAAHVAHWCRRYAVPRAYALLHPLAATLMMLIGMTTLLRRARGLGVEWKGRVIGARA